MPDEAVVKFDPHQFAEQLKDKIRIDIAQFLPEEEWKRLIELEVKAFLEGRWEKDRYYSDHQRYYPSGLRLAVTSVMEANTKRLAEEYFKAHYTAYSDQVAAGVDKIVSENVEGIVRTVMGPLFQRLFNNPDSF